MTTGVATTLATFFLLAGVKVVDILYRVLALKVEFI